jgi:hypothetical protein
LSLTRSVSAIRRSALIAVCFAISSGSAYARPALNDDFSKINASVVRLWNSDPCFNRFTLDAIAGCWANKPDRHAVAREASLDLVARIDNILGRSGQYRAVFQTKLNVLTKAGLFCDQRQLDDTEKEFLANSPNLFEEYSSALFVCAKQTEDSEIYDELRGTIAKEITRYGHSAQVALLKVWFNSYLFQYDPKSDFSKVAPAINRNEEDTWKSFIVALRRVTRYPQFSPIVSGDQLIAARRALDRA